MSRAKSGGKDKEKELSVLSAVIVADSFTDDFKPITLECPRTMMPVSGIVLLDYTIEFLISNGIEEIFVMSCAHAQMIKSHIQEGRWGKGIEVKVKVLISQSATCLAEALRELNGYDVVRRDFVLITGDIIANVSNLKQIWKKHILKRKHDGSILMTLLLKEDSVAMYRSRDALVKKAIVDATTQNLPNAHSDEDLDAPGQHEMKEPVHGVLSEERMTVILDPLTNNMLQYHAWVEEPQINDDSSDSHSSASTVKDKVRVALDMDLFTKYPTLEVRSDLVETGMAICSVEMMLLFEQNPDFKDMTDCIKSVINEELLGNKIVAEILPPNSFVKRVRTIENYISVSQAVLEGWSYPLVVDAPFASQYHCVGSREPTVYIDMTASLSHSCTTGRSTFIGPDVSIAGGTSITHSCLNKNCSVGKNSTIKYSQIWSNAKVGDNCTVDNALVCSNAVIGDGCTVGKYAIISFGVVLAPGTVVPPYTRLTRVKKPESDDESGFGDDNVDIEVLSQGGDEELVGAGGIGRQWTYDLTEAVLDRHKLSFPQDPDASSTDTIFNSSDDSSARSSDDSEPATHDEKFAREVIETVKRAVANDLEFDGVLLEVNSVKFGYDASIVDCCRACLLGMLQVSEESSKPLKTFLATLKKWKELLMKFHSAPVEREILMTLLDFAKEVPVVGKKVRLFIHTLYDVSLLSEKTILDWEDAKIAEEQAGTITPEDKELFDNCQDLFDWLRSSGEEETDSDEEESS